MCSIRLVQLKIINSVPSLRKQFSALQCRLECESGYVAQRTPLITCVNGEYAPGCHYLQKISQNLHTPVIAFYKLLNNKLTCIRLIENF